MSAVDVLRALVVAGTSGTRPTHIRWPTSDEDWREVVRLAVDHRVTAPLADGIAALPEASAPELVGRALGKERMRSVATGLLCESTLAHVLGILRAAGVEVIVLKGATVAHGLYPSPDQRIYHDLDLLCRTRDYPALYRALSASGYTESLCTEPGARHAELSAKQAGCESHQVRGFYDPSGDVKIEVHFDMLQLGLVDRQEEHYWGESRLMDVRGISVRTLRPEHQFLHLAVHAHRHGYSRLSWVLELDMLMRRDLNTMDWAGLSELARSEGVGAVLRHALATSHAVLGSPLPKLPRASVEERVLGLLYRALWSFDRVRALNQHERKRLVHFLPDDEDPRNVLYGLLLLGRRADKLEILGKRLLSRAAR